MRVKVIQAPKIYMCKQKLDIFAESMRTVLNLRMRCPASLIAGELATCQIGVEQRPMSIKNSPLISTMRMGHFKRKHSMLWEDGIFFQRF